MSNEKNADVKKKKKAKEKKNTLKEVKEIIVKYSKIAYKESLNFLKKYKYLIILDIIIFVLTVFIESLYMYKVGKIVWIISTILFISIPTIAMTALNKIKSKEAYISFPILYVFFLIFLKYCTMRDLYGITSGRLDKIPNFIDAIMVVFVFTLIQYASIKLVGLFKVKKK